MKNIIFKIGCSFLPLVILFFTFIILFKFWFIFFLAILVFLFLSSKIDLINVFKNRHKHNNYKAKPGEVYRECKYCNAKAKRTQKTCNICGKAFD